MLNAVTGIVVFAVLWIVTLPLWLTGVGAVLAPVLTSAYLNQRMFRYDALAEHASAEEFKRIRRDARGDLFLLGIALSLLFYVPLVNLLVPVLDRREPDRALIEREVSQARQAKVGEDDVELF